MTPAPMRLRCPADDGSDPARHLALDVRLPLSLDAVPGLLRALARVRCPCGKTLGIDTREETR